MSWIRVAQSSLLLVGLTLLLLSWEYKSFVALLSVFVVFTALIASLVPRYKTIIIPLISVGCILVLVEIVLPIVTPQLRSNTQFDLTTGYASGTYNERIPGFGYRPNPGVYTSRKTTSEGGIIYDVVYSIGRDGYREDVSSTNFNVYIYGGSFTFGEGLNDNETLSFYLLQNHGIRAKNVGVHGYGMHQALYNVEQGFVPHEENSLNVLLTAPWHSLRSACKPFYAAGTPRYEITDEGLKLVGVCSGGGVVGRILQKSNIFSLLTVAMGNETVITDSDIDLYIEIIKEIARLSQKNNSSLLIAFINATGIQLSSTNWTNESIISELSSIATVVDVSLAETSEELDSKYYIHELDEHPSAVANERRAEIISSFIIN